MSGEGDRADLRQRTKVFALRVLRLYAALPSRLDAQVLGRQLLRSGTSVGANYREAYRARSNAEFVAKVGDSSKNWMKRLIGSNCLSTQKLFLENALHLYWMNAIN